MSSVYTGHMLDAVYSYVALEEAQRAVKQGNREAALQAYKEAIACLICENATGESLAFALFEQSRLLFNRPGGRGAALRSLHQATNVILQGRPTKNVHHWQWVLQFIVDLYIEGCWDLAFEAQNHCADLMWSWLDNRSQICPEFVEIMENDLSKALQMLQTISNARDTQMLPIDAEVGTTSDPWIDLEITLDAESFYSAYDNIYVGDYVLGQASSNVIPFARPSRK